jgi:hypothetical protein
MEPVSRCTTEGPGRLGSRSGLPRHDPHPHSSAHHPPETITTVSWWGGWVGGGWGVEGGPRGGEPRVPGVRSLTQASPDTIRTLTRRLTTPPRLSPPFCGGVGGWGAGGGGIQGVPAVVSRGSRASGVTIGTSAPTLVGSPPPRDYHHCFVAGCVWLRLTSQGPYASTTSWSRT